MTKVRILASLLLLWSTGTVHAQLPLPIHVVPLVAAGGDTPDALVSDLVITNVGARAAVVGVRFFPQGQSNQFDATFPRTLTLAAGETRVIRDVVGTLFGEQKAAVGWLLVADATPIDCAALDRPYPALLVVSSRLRPRDATAPAAGTLIRPDWLSLNATQLPSIISDVTPADPAASGRDTVTVGVANVSTEPINVRLKVVDAAGTAAGEAVRAIPPLSLGFWSYADLGLPAVREAGGRLEVALADDGQTWNPCRFATSPQPCADPCEQAICPQRYRLPGFPAFIAFALRAEKSSRSLLYLPSIVDTVGAMRLATEYRQQHCPGVSNAAKLIDLFAKLSLLREPRATQRRPPSPPPPTATSRAPSPSPTP